MRAPVSIVALILAAATCVACQSSRRAASLVVIGGTVITENAAGQVLSPGAVAIDGTTIVDVDRPDIIQSKYAARETIDVRDQILLPGLINTHTHAPMVLFRGLADDLALMDWLQKYIFPAEARTVSPEFVRVGTRLAALEMIESGTTTYADMYYFEEEIAGATRAAGLRGVLGQTIIQFPVADAQTPAEGLRRAEAFIQAFRADSLIVPAVAPHAMYTLDRDSLLASAALARRYNVPVLIHLAETEDEAKQSQARHQLSPAGYLESIGFWGPRTLAAHGIWVNDDDIAILARRGVGLSHNPESNMKLASGIAPLSKYTAAGVSPRPRHRRRREQQRPRHVRGDASGGISGQAGDSRPDRRSRGRSAGHGDDWRRTRARHGPPDRVARARKARRSHQRVHERGASDAALRSDFAPRLRHAEATTCRRRS